MSQKQRAKHIADKQPVAIIPVGTALTPDGLGRWKGGLPKSSTLLQRKVPTQFASNKNTPGKSSNEIVERSADYFKRIAEEAKPTKEYDSASIEVLKGMEPPVQHGEAYVPETTN